MNKWIEILKTKLFSKSLKSSSLTQSSTYQEKTQEHQEHFMVFGKYFDQTLRTNLARHEVN
jgi:hypothetical protein